MVPNPKMEPKNTLENWLVLVVYCSRRSNLSAIYEWAFDNILIELLKMYSRMFLEFLVYLLLLCKTSILPFQQSYTCWLIEYDVGLCTGQYIWPACSSYVVELIRCRKMIRKLIQQGKHQFWFKKIIDPWRARI